jgi:hypothetical protein
VRDGLREVRGGARRVGPSGCIVGHGRDLQFVERNIVLGHDHDLVVGR